MARRYPTQPTETGTPFGSVPLRFLPSEKHTHNCMKFGVLTDFMRPEPARSFQSGADLPVEFVSEMP
jgi:hypothetical protein